MSFREKIKAVQPHPDPVVALVRPVEDSAGSYQDIKARLHMKLVEQFDLSTLETLSPELLRQEIARLTERLLQDESVAVNESERRQLVRDIQHEMLGFGPLELLMADPKVSDILVNSYRQIYVERQGRLELTPVSFQNETHLMRIIEKIVSRVGRRIDESSPMVDARLPDGSRVNVAIPPVAIDGAMMSIRRFAHVPLKMENLCGDELRSLTPDTARMLEGLVKAKVNLLISGGTGSGKTTLLNILSGYIPEGERVVTIEDAAELQLQQAHVVRMETRPANLEGRGEINQRALVRNALRMRPDRIVIGEVRGAEALDMLQAMNTGHDGSLTTIHANTPRDAVMRLENMIGMAGINLPTRAVRQQIASAITVVVQSLRLIDGRRKITSIQEITGMEGDVVTMQEIYGYKQTGVGADGRVQGHFAASGVRPKFMDRLRAFGVHLPETLFDPSRHSNEERLSCLTRCWPEALGLALAAFVAVLLLAESLYLLWQRHFGAEARRLRKRLHHLAQAHTQAQAATMRPDEPGMLRAWLSRSAWLRPAQALLRQASLTWDPASLVLGSLAAAAGLGLLAHVLLRQAWWVALVPAALGAAAPWAWVMWRRAQRLAALQAQLPEALDLMARALRAGHAFSASLQMVADEMPEPLASEFRTVHDEVNVGLNLSLAFEHLIERAPLPDMRYFVVAALIQREAGGNLTELLDKLSQLIRARLKFLGRVRVLSSEGRLSGWILVSMPFALGALLTALNPEFMRPLWTDPHGQTMPQWMLGLMLLGIWLMRKIVRIRV